MEINTKIKTYEIIEEIGHGGMANIFKANQPSLDRFIVLKKLKESSPELIERFKREAVVAASLNQENIISTFDFFQENEDYYLVLEHVKGQDLNTILSIMSPLPVTIATMIIREVALGLEYAHLHGVIHRDIKPGNVMVSESGDVKIIDFGLVKNESPTDLTRTDVLIGTPIYMAPEQLNGDVVTDQTDIYSLGVMLYELVTGLKPFTASSNTELFTQISQGKYRCPKTYHKNLSNKLVKIINKAMHHSTDKRYANISELLRDINKFLKKENLLNLKQQISNFMLTVKLTAGNETISMKKPVENFNLNNTSHSWKPSIAVVLLILTFGACFLGGYELYTRDNYGSLYITINVPEGEIIKDGEHKSTFKNGHKKLKKLLPGPHSLRISASESYSIFESEFQISSGQTDTINVNLFKQRERATLTLNSQPNGAHIYINDKFWGKSPIKNKKVTTGIHNIEVVHPGFQKWKSQKKFNINEDIHLFVSLKKTDLSLK